MTGDVPEARGRHAASAVLGAARSRAEPRASTGPRFPRVRRTLSADLRQEITSQFTKGEFCTFCGKIHSGMSMPACPRIASCDIDADGNVRAVQFWADGDYDESGTYSAADVETDDEPSA